MTKLRIILLLSIFLCGILIFVLILRPTQNEKPVVIVPSPKNTSSLSSTPSPTILPSPTQLESTKKYQIAIVIDDLGYDNKELKEFFELGIPLSFAVLPDLPGTKDAVEEVARRKFPLLLHQPLEAQGNEDPGPGLIRTGDTKEKMERTFLENLSEIPGVIGWNNHMGSKGSENPILLKVLLKKSYEKKLIFLDSRTSALSKGYEIAKELGLRAFERDVFLDNDKDEKQIDLMLTKTLEIARSKGYAIAIGHIYGGITAKTIGKFIKNNDMSEFVFVRLDEVRSE